MAPPELQHPDSDTLYLEAWRGLRPIGNSVNISVTSLILVRKGAAWTYMCWPALLIQALSC